MVNFDNLKPYLTDINLNEIEEELSNNEIKLKHMGQCGRSLFIEKYDFPIAANRFNNLFMQICNS